MTLTSANCEAQQLQSLVKSGALRVPEDTTDAPANAPTTPVDLLSGANRGKRLVCVG